MLICAIEILNIYIYIFYRHHYHFHRRHHHLLFIALIVFLIVGIVFLIVISIFIFIIIIIISYSLLSSSPLSFIRHDHLYFHLYRHNSQISRDVVAAMLMYRTIAKKVFREDMLSKTWATFCHCFVHQHGRLIMWVKTKSHHHHLFISYLHHHN